MGFKAIQAVMHHSQSKGNTRLVALAIASFYDDVGDNGAFPSQEVLAKIANVNKRTVQRAIVELQELGEIDVHIHSGRGKTFNRQTNRYYIVLDCPDWCDRSVNHREYDDSLNKDRRQNWQSMTTDSTNNDDTPVVLTINNRNETDLNVYKLRSVK